MARPRLIFDETKDIHVWISMSLWQKLNVCAYQRNKKGVGVSTIVREILEKEFNGQEG